MKRIHTIGLLLLLVISSSCSIMNSITNNQLMNIQKGMTPEQVTAVLKRAPDYRRFDNGAEEWEYRGYKGNEYSALIVWFVDGRVDGMDSFKIPTPVAAVTPVPERTFTAGTHQGSADCVWASRTGRPMNREEFGVFIKDLKSGFSSVPFSHL